MNTPTATTQYFKHIVTALQHGGQVSLVLNEQLELIYISPYAYDVIFKDSAPTVLPSLQSLFAGCNEPSLHRNIELFKSQRQDTHTQLSIRLPQQEQDINAELFISTTGSGMTIIVIRLSGHTHTLEAINEEQTFQAILQHASVAIWFIDTTGNMNFFNRSFCETFGQAKEEFLNILHYCQHLPLQIATSCLNSDMHVLQTRQPYTTHSRVKLKDGRLKFMEITKVPLYNNDGSIRGIIGIASDLSDMQQAKDELLREKDRAMVTLSAIGDGVITTDNNGIVDFINPAAERLLSYSSSESIGTPINTIFIRKDIDSLIEKNFEFNSTKNTLPFLGRSRSILTNKNGKELLIQESIASIHNNYNGRQTGLVITFKDHTETKKLTDKLEHFSKHDALTGLLNRQELFRLIEDEIKKEQPSSILTLIDLDQFKIIMNTAGNNAGNFLIKYVADGLSKITDNMDFIGRLSNDTFGILSVKKSIDDSKSMSRKISQHFKNNPFLWENSQYNLSSSIGIVEIGKETLSTDQVITQANIASYTAKESGRGRFHIYKEHDKPIFKLQDDLLIVQDIEYALENNTLELYAQPIISLKYPEQQRIEILVRMHDRKKNLIMPNDFIPAAENYGLMPQVDAWILENIARNHFNDLVHHTNLTVNINLSGKSLSSDSLMQRMSKFLSKKTLITRRLCFEITETSAIKQMDVALKFMNFIRGLGCQLALDDFGSGLSSLRYLKNLPVDIVKIDGSFVVNMDKDKVDHAMVSSISSLAKVIGIEVVAEFVENSEIEYALKKLGIDYAQGFHYSKPVPLKQYLKELKNQKPLNKS